MMNMQAGKPWLNPVTIETNPAERPRIIGNTRKALNCLKVYWPIAGGEAYDRAIEVCSDALDGTRGTESAREAFVEAAKEAGLRFRL